MKGHWGGCPESDGLAIKAHEFTEIVTFSYRFQVRICTQCGERQWRWSDFWDWEVLDESVDLSSMHASTVACLNCGAEVAEDEGHSCGSGIMFWERSQ